MVSGSSTDVWCVHRGEQPNSAAATAGEVFFLSLKEKNPEHYYLCRSNLLTREEDPKTLKRFFMNQMNSNQNIVNYKVVDLFEYYNFVIKFVFTRLRLEKL